MILHSKVRIDGGGGGRNRMPSLRDLMYSANVAIYLDQKTGVKVHKNRWGATGKVSTNQLIEILCLILVEQIFNGRMKLFQEGMRIRLIWAIKKIVKRGNI